MAPDQIASELAATFYAASLLPNPTLKRRPKAEALDAYRDKGTQLATTLLTPQRRAVIRCECGTKTAHPDRSSRVIAAVHDRSLVVVRRPRRSNYAPPSDRERLRLIDHLLIDLGIAHRDGFKSVSVWCYGCGALHDLGLGWLKRARLNEISTQSKPHQLAPWGDPIVLPGYTPRHRNDANRLAFATTTGPLDSPQVIVTLGWLYAFDYRDHFGFKPPHEAHLLRLTRGLDRYEEPWLWEMLTPQWRRYQLYPEDRELDGWNQPIHPRELRGLARAIASEEPDERQDAILLFQEVLTPRRFGTLQRLIQKETR